MLGSPSKTALSVRDWYRILSRASLEFEMSSRRKIWRRGGKRERGRHQRGTKTKNKLTNMAWYLSRKKPSNPAMGPSLAPSQPSSLISFLWVALQAEWCSLRVGEEHTRGQDLPAFVSSVSERTQERGRAFSPPPHPSIFSSSLSRKKKHYPRLHQHHTGFAGLARSTPSPINPPKPEGASQCTSPPSASKAAVVSGHEPDQDTPHPKKDLEAGNHPPTGGVRSRPRTNQSRK